MSASPETRQSLLFRLKDRADDEAWFEFTEIYRPLIYRLARHKGLQHADADDLVQQVLAAVARVIDRWETDPNRARFRTWLSRVATNAIINALSRGAADRGSGDSGLQDLLGAHPAGEGPASDLIRTEHRREVFRWAARQIRPEFQPITYGRRGSERRGRDARAGAIARFDLRGTQPRHAPPQGESPRMGGCLIHV